MAISITRSSYGKPTLSLALVAGGSLPVGVTLYYRVATASYRYLASGYLSPISDVQSITTDSAHRSVQLTVTHSTGAAEYTAVWCHEGADPGVGNWLDADTYPDIRYLGQSSLNMGSTTLAKWTLWTDDGTITGWTSSAYQLGIGANYGFVPLYEAGKDYLSITGTDPTNFEEIYQYCVSQGWPAESTITRVSTPDVPRYWIRASQFYLYAPYEETSVDLIVDCCVARLYGGTTIGTYDSSADDSSYGIGLILTGHSSMTGSVSFYGASDLLYDTHFLVMRHDYSAVLPYSAALAFYSSHFEIVDCHEEGLEASYGLDEGLKITGGDATSFIKRVRVHNNRYSI